MPHNRLVVATASRSGAPRRSAVERVRLWREMRRRQRWSRLRRLVLPTLLRR